MSAHSQINVPLVSLPVLFHDMLKRPQKVFLESEVGELALLQEFHGQLPERVHSENRHIFICVTSNLRGGKTYLSNMTPFVLSTLHIFNEFNKQRRFPRTKCSYSETGKTNIVCTDETVHPPAGKQKNKE